MPRITKLIYRFVGWLCREHHQHPRDCALLHRQVSQFQHCLTSPVSNERCFHQVDRTKQAFPIHIHTCNYWKKGPLQSKLHLRVGSALNSDLKKAQGFVHLSLENLQEGRGALWALLHCPVGAAPQCHERCSPPAAARQIWHSFQCPALLQLPAVPIHFPTFSQNPAAVAAYL